LLLMASSVSAVIQKMEQNFASFAIEKDFKPHSKIHCAAETDIKKVCRGRHTLPYGHKFKLLPHRLFH
ncbi:MAG: hypothetical protein LUP91_06445, partial [Methylococcaceae bacterium]|nr:hypothetical protein [Methylococcaceae bacterium]